jgi:poly(hydroxyalkanoate) depolymerase family esterase
MRMKLAAYLVLGLVTSSSIAFAADTAPDGEGTWTRSTYKNSYGQRNYALYVPKKGPKGLRPDQAAPLLVMLHGCGQDAAAFARATRMNTLADRRGFVVLYPEQDKASNSSQCWNWFSSDNFVRGGGELGIITGMIEKVRAEMPIDAGRIGVAGFSAGAALATDLAACHSDLFSLAVMSAGLEFKAASSLTEAYLAMVQTPSLDLKTTAPEAARCTGPGARMTKLLLIQGKSDSTVNPKNAGRIVEQFTIVNDLLDDRQANGTQTNVAYKTESSQVPGGHTYQVLHYGEKGHERIREVEVDGMSHAWSGGASGLPFSDPSGPNASEMAAELLLSP